MGSPLFYAKILLFGEYGVIENSQGLTLPYSFYKGCLKFSDFFTDFEKRSNDNLKDYVSYLNHLDLPEDFALDIVSFQKDIDKGLYFDSDIPQGYGIGSSGALVAAVFERYSVKKYRPEDISKEDLKSLRKIFGKLEGYFHGKSSGIDPLICFVNLPILIENKENVDRAFIPEEQGGKGAIFLIDSGVIGETGPMVQIFFEKLKNEGFRKTLKEEFIKYNNACIDFFLKKDMIAFFKNLKALSKWAYEHLRPMIPGSIFRIWREGLETNVYYLKLCGSGGGGYILGFARDYAKAEKMLSGFHKEVIYRF